MTQSFIETINVNFPGLGRAINFAVVKYNILMFPWSRTRELMIHVRPVIVFE